MNPAMNFVVKNMACFLLGFPMILVIALFSFNKTPLTTAAILVLAVFPGIYFCMLCKFRASGNAPSRKTLPTERTPLLPVMPSLVTRFRYSDLVKATKGFRKKIGTGAFSSVYFGTLTDGTEVAVKFLEISVCDSAATELSAISALNHSNLLRLIGVCEDRSHTIFVFEYMKKGSLDRWIFSTPNRKQRLDWKTRRSIAIDIAKGLSCLHNGSTRCILHLDIKPENILLDENFRAKVSDFNLARSLEREAESRFFTAHMWGTRGYMAPEWLFQRGITSKSDVFSYGMVLLEIVSGRRCVDQSLGESLWYLPHVAFRNARHGKIHDMLDPELERPENMDEIVNLIRIALSCVQQNPSLRPSMSEVVFMAEGGSEMPVEPRSYRFSPDFPFASSPLSTDTSQVLA